MHRRTILGTVLVALYLAACLPADCLANSAPASGSAHLPKSQNHLFATGCEPLTVWVDVELRNRATLPSNLSSSNLRQLAEAILRERGLLSPQAPRTGERQVLVVGLRLAPRTFQVQVSHRRWMENVSQDRGGYLGIGYISDFGLHENNFRSLFGRIGEEIGLFVEVYAQANKPFCEDRAA